MSQCFQPGSRTLITREEFAVKPKATRKTTQRSMKIQDLPQEVIDNITRFLPRPAIVALYQTSRAQRHLTEGAYYKDIFVGGKHARNDFLRFLYGLMPARQTSSSKPAHADSLVAAKVFHKRDYIKRVTIGFGRAESPQKYSDAYNRMEVDGEDPPWTKDTKEGMFDICQMVQLIHLKLPKAPIRLQLLERQFPRLSVPNDHVHCFPGLVELDVEYGGASHMSYFNDVMVYDRKKPPLLVKKPTECLISSDIMSQITPGRTALECPNGLFDFFYKETFPNLRRIALHSKGSRPLRPKHGSDKDFDRPPSYAKPASGHFTVRLEDASSDMTYHVARSMHLAEYLGYSPSPLHEFCNIKDSIPLVYAPLLYLRKLTLKNCSFLAEDLCELIEMVPVFLPSCTHFQLLEKRRGSCHVNTHCICESFAQLLDQVHFLDVVLPQLCLDLIRRWVNAVKEEYGDEAMDVLKERRGTRKIRRLVSMNGSCESYSEPLRSQSDYENGIVSKHETRHESWEALDNEAKEISKAEGDAVEWIIANTGPKADTSNPQAFRWVAGKKHLTTVKKVLRDIEDDEEEE